MAEYDQVVVSQKIIQSPPVQKKVKYNNMTTTTATTVVNYTMLDDNIWNMILEYIPAMDLLKNVNHVNTHFAILLSDDSFWNIYSQNFLFVCYNNNKKGSNYSIIKNKQYYYDLNMLQIQQICVFVTSDWKSHIDHKLDVEYMAALFNAVNEPTIIYPCLLQQSLLPTITDAIQLKTQNNPSRRVCLASSTHHIETESIERTLSPDNIDNVRWLSMSTPGWWSSLPNLPNSNEDILYITSSNLTLITQITIEPLIDTFNRIRQVYTWDYTKITAYTLPQSLIATGSSTTTTGHSSIEFVNTTPDDTPNSDTNRINNLLKDQIPVYESSQFVTPPVGDVINQDNQAVIHNFPVGVVANTVRITLYGKRARERLGYYACIDHVIIKGIPLLHDKTNLIESLQERVNILHRRTTRRGGSSESESQSDSSSSSSSNNDSSDYYNLWGDYEDVDDDTTSSSEEELSI